MVVRLDPSRYPNNKNRSIQNTIVPSLKTEIPKSPKTNQGIIQVFKLEFPESPKTSQGVIFNILQKFPKALRKQQPRNHVILLSPTKKYHLIRTSTYKYHTQQCEYFHARTSTTAVPTLLLWMFGHRLYNQLLLLWWPQRPHTATVAVSGATAQNTDFPYEVHVITDI